MASYQGDTAAQVYADTARVGLTRFPLHVLVGSKWPLIALLTGDLPCGDVISPASSFSCNS